MKKFVTVALIAMVLLFTAESQSFAAPAHKTPTVVVLSDTGHRNGTTYVICGASADIIATDIINELNKTGRIKAPLLGENMSKITQKNIPLYYQTFFREYKYNYNIDFVNLKRVTKDLKADYIIMVTSGLDVQSNFLKETWWNKLSIAGIDPVIPTYKLTTLVTLIDIKNGSIMWQDLYLRDISAKNYDLGITQFSPSYAQLSKIKKYSKNVSQYVTNVVDRQVNPWIVPPKEPKSIEMRSRFLNEGTKIYYPTVNGEVVKQNFDDMKEQNRIERERKQHEKMLEQSKHIENVGYVKKKQKNKPEKEERLFDSIRNNIDDVSNTLPPTKAGEAEENIKPAVLIQPKTEEVKPVLEKPVNQVKPVVKPDAKANPVKPVNNIKQKPATKEPPQKEEPKPELPHYDWNLRNIYLQKIGSDKPFNQKEFEKFMEEYKRTAQIVI